jgi:hypothetical protein
MASETPDAASLCNAGLKLAVVVDDAVFCGLDDEAVRGRVGDRIGELGDAELAAMRSEASSAIWSACISGSVSSHTSAASAKNQPGPESWYYVAIAGGASA